MANPLSMKIHEVAMRAVNDPDFAIELRQAALAALKGGSRSQAFKDYFDRFATTPGELANLGVEFGANCACLSNTYLTLSSMVSPVPVCCNTTTTTTTSGNFFGV